MTSSNGRVTLQRGDYIATNDLTEDEYHAVARAFMAAGAGKGEYQYDNYYTPERAFGIDNRSNSLFHGRPGTDGDVLSLCGRQLTLSQILNARNAGCSVEPETTTEWKMVERMANNIPQMRQEHQEATLKEHDRIVELGQKFNEATSELHAVKVALSKKEQELLKCHMDIDKLFGQCDQQESNLREATKLINTQSESISKLKQDNDNYQLLVPSLDKLVRYVVDRQLGTPNENVVDVIISYCENLRERIDDPNPTESGYYKVRTNKEGSIDIAFFELNKGWSFISDEEKYQSVHRVIEKVEV